MSASAAVVPPGPHLGPAAVRKTIEDTIEALIALLDELDGDPDMEAAAEDEIDECDLEDEPDREIDEAERGIGDSGGLEEVMQRFRFVRYGGDPRQAARVLQAKAQQVAMEYERRRGVPLTITMEMDQRDLGPSAPPSLMDPDCRA